MAHLFFYWLHICLVYIYGKNDDMIIDINKNIVDKGK
jgi:hypothetical protein